MPEKNMKLEVSPEVSKGTFSNIAVITHSPTEMVLDFAQLLPGQQSAVVRDRIIMTPLHAKQLLMALSDNIQKYESQYGIIEPPVQSNVPKGGTIPYEPMGNA